jgi:hypothetical protein
MDLNFYRFRSQWQVPAAPTEAYGVLSALAEYPRWWSEVRRAVQVSDDVFEVTVRSLLPYDLDFVSRQARQDAEAGILEAAMTGDLEGFSRWTISPVRAGTRLVFEEEVVVAKPLLRRLAAVARPAFRANHALMMRHGERGLRTFLAGYHFGRTHH